MEIQRGRYVSSIVVCAVVLGTTLLVRADDPDQYSPWAVPVSLGATVNTVSAEFYPFVSKDGLSLYFSSDRPGGFGGWDVWVAQRFTTDEPWGPPVNVGPGVNTPYDESAPTISIDGHLMYFQSNRPGGVGNGDLYLTRRHNKRDDFGWQAPQDLGSGVNSAFNEAAPAIFEDDSTGTITLYFSSDRPGGPGPVGPSGPGVNGQQGSDIYASTLQPDETFGSPWLVSELSGPSLDRRVLIRRDGLELFLTSNRAGGIGLMDIWVSTRGATTEPWSAPTNLGPLVNGTGPDAGAAVSFEGTTLYFQSVRPWPSSAFYDLWMTTRQKRR
jgi:WD40-like Beta Propeller Repeat